MSRDRKAYLVGRLLQSLLTLLVIMSLTFVMFRMLPADPATALLDPSASEEQKVLLRERLGLDQPVGVQYLTYMKRMLSGEFGLSFATGRDALLEVRPAFINTLFLVIASNLLSYGIGAILGAYMAWRRGSWFDNIATTLALIFRSAPPFWLGLMAIFLFSFQLGWFPIGGMRTAGFEATGMIETYLNWDFVHHASLPIIVASLYFVGLPMLLMRASMLEVLGEDYIDLVRAKGLRENAVLFRHVVRNALLPIFTQATSQFGWAMGGLMIVEYIFSWPGLGSLLVQSVHSQDLPVAQGALFFIAITVLSINLLTDLAYSYIDPRVDLN
jgi:peptide/nickel transport system permease protein